MSGGNGGSGGGGGVHGDGGARAFGPQEQQIPGSQVGQMPDLSPGWAVQRAQRVAAGDGTEGTEEFWMGTWPLALWPAGVCCDCIAVGAGGGQRAGLDAGALSGTHPDLHGLSRCHRAPYFAEGHGSRDI